MAHRAKPAAKSAARRKPLPNVRLEKFISLCASLGNRTQAYIRAGYAGKYPDRCAYDLARKPEICERIRQAIDAQVGGRQGLTSRLAEQADANLADFEPWLKGRKTLKQLARMGVDTRCVKSATIRTGDEGETRRIELHSSQEAIWKLVRMAGYGEGGEDPDAPKAPQVSVTVDLGKMLARRMAESAALPPAPGLPAVGPEGPMAGTARRSRFSGEGGASPLFSGAQADAEETT